MKRILTLATYLLTATLSLTLAHAAEITGRSTGQFVNPQGEENIMVNGVDTAFFRWGDETYQGNPYYWNIGDNWLKFEGNSFSIISESQFIIGRLTYFNGTTAPSTHATSVELKLTLTFSDGTKKHFSFPYQLINTPNKSTRIEERADIVKFIQPFSENVLTVDGQEYRLKLIFGRTTENGFAAIDRFHVYEGEQASAEIQAVFTKETPPPPPPPRSSVRPDTDYYSFQQQQQGQSAYREVQPSTLTSSELDVSNWGSGRIATSQSSSSQQRQNAQPQNSLSREVNVNRLPRQDSKLSAQTYEEFQAQRRSQAEAQYDTYNQGRTTERLLSQNQQQPAYRPASSLPPKPTQPTAAATNNNRRPDMRLSERSLTDSERQNWESSMPSSQAPIDLSDVGDVGEIPVPLVKINRAISLRFDTVPGYVYQIKASHDGRNWSDLGGIIVGDGEEVMRMRELNDDTESKYKVEVSHSRNP